MDFATSILELITCLWSCTSPHLTRVGEFENNLHSLRCATGELRDLSEDVKRRIELAEQQQVVRTRKQVEGWLQRAEVLEKEASQILDKGEREIQSRCFWGRCPRNCYSSHRVGEKVEKMLSSLKKEQSKGYLEIVADELPYVLVEERPLENVVGLDLIFLNAWRCIVEKQVGILGLYGLGGVGKTTLLTKINNEFINHMHDFKLVIWIAVPKRTSIKEVQEVIRNRLNFKDANWHRKTEDEKAATIYKFLRGKKFVLLLDDLRERLDLSRVGIPLSGGTIKGKVIFTTRSQEVCSQMEAQMRIKVTCLAQFEANTLFNARVGEETLNSHPEIRELAPSVSKECDGLPLALITVGRSMAEKKDPRDWKRAIEVLRNSPSKFTGMRDHVFTVLRFSYDSLHDETIKQCFLYCSLYPEDYDIPKNNLIEHWIGEGLIRELHDINEARSQGNDIIEILKSVCLLETDKSGNCVKMHDVIRDMALWIASENAGGGNMILVEQHTRTIGATRVAKWTMAERVAVFGANSICQSPTCPNLVTLFVNDCGLTKFPLEFFQHMPTIRVLDLSNNCDLAEFPVEITMLVTLQYLDLSSTRIDKLPAELKNLTEMRHLLLNHMKDLTIISEDVIGKFSHLRVLSMNYACSEDFLDEIIEDNVLSGGKEPLLQELEMAENFQDLCVTLTTPNSVTKLLISEKLRQSIRCLYLKRCNNMTEIVVPFTFLEQMVNLETLQIRNCRSLNRIRVHSSVHDSSGFQGLCSVTITDCPMVEMTWLMHVPNLESLHIQGCKLLEEVLCDDPMLLDYEKHRRVFCRLATIMLFDLPELKVLCPRSLPFPSLEKMSVTLCPSLRKLPFDSTSAQNRLKEIVGWPSWWNQLEWEDDGIEPIFRAHFRASS